MVVRQSGPTEDRCSMNVAGQSAWSRQRQIRMGSLKHIGIFKRIEMPKALMIRGGKSSDSCIWCKRRRIRPIGKGPLVPHGIVTRW